VTAIVSCVPVVDAHNDVVVEVLGENPDALAANALPFVGAGPVGTFKKDVRDQIAVAVAVLCSASIKIGKARQTG
jgi:hypothetical protein